MGGAAHFHSSVIADKRIINTPLVIRTLLLLMLVLTPACMVEMRRTGGFTGEGGFADNMRTQGGAPIFSLSPNTKDGHGFKEAAVLLLTQQHGHQARAEANRLAAVAREQGLPGARVLVFPSDVVCVVQGHFEDATDSDARAQLEHARRIRFGDSRPFHQANFVPVSRLHGALPTDPLDATAHPGKRTLIVATYTADWEGEPDTPEDAAEALTKLLREQGPGDDKGGIEAYYLHSTLTGNSYVCAGLFDAHDMGRNAQGAETFGPRILALQKRFDLALENEKPVPLTDFRGNAMLDSAGRPRFHKPGLFEIPAH